VRYSPNTTLALSVLFLVLSGLFGLGVLPMEWLSPIHRGRFVPETALLCVIFFGIAVYQYWQQDRDRDQG
jgi:hypothetical protein